MSRRRFGQFVRGILVIVSLSTSLAGQCNNWLEALGRSFLPKQVDAQALDAFSRSSPENYFAAANESERAMLREIAGELSRSPQYENRLKIALSRFYSIGEELYGVRLDSDNVAVRSAADLNAGASGSFIFMNEGLLLYYIDPINYLQRIGQLPSNLNRNQYLAVSQTFSWREDWNGIYFVLAHEAGHNLMRHRHQQIFEHMQAMVGDYQQQVVDHRKDIAEGKSGRRVGRYLWRSTLNFLGAFGDAQKHRELESEADLIAMVLLKRAGLDPRIALQSAERMALLSGGGGGAGFSRAMTTVLCSSHPDWLIRVQTMQSNLGCVQFQGAPCQQRIAYPVESVLPDMKKTLTAIEQYNRQTEEIASGSITSSDFQFVEFNMDPKDARLLVDGQPFADKKVNLRVGPHEAVAVKDGMQSEPISFVVYPDVKAKVKLKIRK